MSDRALWPGLGGTPLDLPLSEGLGVTAVGSREELKNVSRIWPLKVLLHSIVPVSIPMPTVEECPQGLMRNLWVVDLKEQFSTLIPGASREEQCIFSVPFCTPGKHCLFYLVSNGKLSRTGFHGGQLS
jgi:hypothetical protein